MVEAKSWASLEDFATLFCYFWHRDFPITPKAIGALRTDWTKHIDFVVQNIANFMGYYPRYESSGHKDAVIRNANGQDVIALEWEWSGVYGNEIDKLKEFANKKDNNPGVAYCVFVSYAHTPNIQKVYEHVSKKWSGVICPLLLILIDFIDSKEYFSGRAFVNINISVFDRDKFRELRSIPAFPWNIEGTWRQVSFQRNTKA